MSFGQRKFFFFITGSTLPFCPTFIHHEMALYDSAIEVLKNNLEKIIFSQIWMWRSDFVHSQWPSHYP
jgi:hypothetical protein